MSQNLSLVSVQIQMRFRETVLATATSFVYRYLDREFLITNWHNVTGRHSQTKHPLSPNGAVPDNIVLHLPFTEEIEGKKVLIRWRFLSLSLYEEGNEEVPNWYEHPQYGEGVDVAVIRIEGLESDTSIFAANAPSLELSDLMLKAGMDVHVLGFPRGIVGGARFPIWKRGSIASEPDIDIQGKPMLYIDTATREGMSGAPVYAQESGFWAPEGKELLEEGFFGKGHRFLGIYSGRVGDDEFSAQLGIVWKERAIVEIIEGGQLGKSSFLL